MRNSKTLYTLCLTAFLCMNGVGMAVSALPAKLLSLSGPAGSPAWSPAWLASAFAASYVLLQIPGGRLADRFGCKPLLAAGFLLMAVSGLCYHAARGADMIFVGRFVQGLGEAPVWAAAPALLSRLNAGAEGRSIGLYGFFFQLGLTTGPLAGALGLASPFATFAALCGLCAAAVLLLVREPDALPAPTAGSCEGPNTRGRDSNPGSGQGISPRWEAWALTAGVVLSGGVYGLVVSVIPAFLLEYRGASPERTMVLFSLTYLAFGAAQFLSGALSDRLGRRWFMVAGLLASGLALGPFARLEAWAAPLLLFPAGFGLGAFATASLAHRCEQASENRRGTASGQWFMAWGAGYFALPLALESAGAEFGFPALGAALLLAGTALSLGAFTRRRA